jgi:hypothetical protein
MIEPRLYGTGLPAQNIYPMLRREEWRALDSPNQQLLLLCDFAQNECATTLSAAIVARVFENEVSQVWKIPSEAHKQAKPPLRPPVFPPEQEDAIVTLIETNCHNRDFVSQRDLNAVF